MAQAFSATLLVVAVFLAGGCGDDKPQTAPKGSNPTVPRSYETSDGKLEFSEGGDSVRVETPDGKSMLINGRLPDDFPKSFPILTGAVIQTSSVQEKSDAIVRTTRYYINGEAGDAYEKYLDLLPKAGYALGEQKRVDNGPTGFDGTIVFKGEGDLDKDSGVVSVSINKQQVQVSITLTTAR